MNIRFYEPGDDEGILELLRKTFPKWAAFEDPMGLWRWKYVDTPLNSFIIVATADDKIVGCEHSIIFKIKIGSEITTVSYNDDLAIDKDYRGMGIWNKIRKLKNEEFILSTEYVLATTINPVVRKSWDKRNLALFPFAVTRMVKTQDIDNLLEEYPVENKPIIRLGYISLSTINKITNIIKPPIKPGSEFHITQITKFDKSIDAFWDKVKGDYNFIIEKMHPYLNWRFKDNDRGTHVKFQAMDGDVVLGYVVVGYKTACGEGQVVDLLALNDRVDVASALLESGCKFLGSLGVNTLFYQVVVGHPYQELSARHGFIDSNSRPNIALNYTTNWSGGEKTEIPYLKHTNPNRVYFSYATTL
jgi:hypothetical protein